MRPPRDGERSIHRPRDRWEARGLRELMRYVTGGFEICGLGDDEIPIGARKVRPCPGETRFSLGHVRARHLAHFKAILGGAEFFRQKAHVVFTQVDEGLGLQHVEKGVRGKLERVLLHRYQVLTRGKHQLLLHLNRQEVIAEIEKRHRGSKRERIARPFDGVPD